MAPAERNERLRRFLVADDHRRVHGETGVPPQARWEASGFPPRLPESAAQLDLLLLTVPTARRIHRDGICFQGLRYLDLTLAAYVGEDVTIRYPHHYSRIGFVHRFRLLSEEELRCILAHRSREVGLTFSPDDYADAEVLAASSPAATSAWSDDCSARSSGCRRSNACRRSPTRSSRPPARASTSGRVPAISHVT